MIRPAAADWMFAGKTFAAAMLALYIAFVFDLPRPYWAAATVYITSQVLSGATRSKAVYRLVGTLVGAAVAIVVVPALIDAPALFCVVMAAWVAVCLYVSLLDRTPRGYMIMLAGYTAPLIGFPGVDDPGAIFETAISRAEEISLGILCASLVSSLIWPQTVAAVLAAWLATARDASLAALEGTRAGGPLARAFAADVLVLETFATHLGFEASRRRRSPKALASLRQTMLVLGPMLDAIADRVAILRARAALPPAAERVLADVAAMLAADDTSATASARVGAAAAALVMPSPVGWNALLLDSLMVQLIDVLDLRQEMRALLRHVADGSTPAPSASRFSAVARRTRHRDHGMALRSALSVFVATLATAAVWIATGWPDGSAAPMFAAVVCCFFAAQDDPVPAIVEFAWAAVLGSLVAGVYLFAILPMATTFEAVVLMLAPPLLICGVLMTQPRTAGLALGSAIFGLSLLAIQSSYAGDLPGFTNSALAVIGGILAAALVTSLVRSVEAAWMARRLLRLNRRTFAAAVRGPRDDAALLVLMLDRLALVAARLGASHLHDEHAALVRAGLAIVALRRGRHRLSTDARTALDRVMACLCAATDGDGAPATPALLAAIDDGLDAIISVGGRDAVLGLVGLRCALFSEAPDYEPHAALEARRAPEPMRLAG